MPEKQPSHAKRNGLIILGLFLLLTPLAVNDALEIRRQNEQRAAAKPASAAAEETQVPAARRAENLTESERILAEARDASRTGRAARALERATFLLVKHPDAPESEEARLLADSLREIVAEEKAREEQRRAEARATDLARKWSYHSSTDQMTGGAIRTATIESENTVYFDSPYDGAQRGRLTLRTHPSYGRDVIFRIERGQLPCFQGCRVRIRFDEGLPGNWTALEPADHSTEVLFIRGYNRFVQLLRKAETVRIQVRAYQEGEPIFRFEVGGFDYDRYANGR